MNRDRWMIVAAAVAAVLFLLIASALHTDAAIALDHFMAELLEGNRFLIFFTLFGDATFIAVVLLIAAVVLYIRRDMAGLLFLGISAGGGTALNQGLKLLFGRQRPDIPDQLSSFSFPSGHSQMGIVYLIALAFLFARSARSGTVRRIVWAAAMVLTVLIGLSRIALGRHFATDVLGGWSLGLAWSLLLLSVFNGSGKGTFRGCPESTESRREVD